MSTGLNKQMGYTVAHPALPTPNDVVKLNLYATVNDAAGEPIPVTPGDTHEVIVPVDSRVEITFTSVDDAGNESPRSPALAFTATDDIPPDAPGAPTVVSHREVLAPGPNDPTPTPPADVNPAPDTPVTPAPPEVQTDPNQPPS